MKTRFESAGRSLQNWVRFRRACAGLGCAVLLDASQPVALADYLWKQDFEGAKPGLLRQPEDFAALGLTRSSAGPSTEFEVVGAPHPVRAGTSAFRIKLNRVDNASYRAEVTLKGAQFQHGREYWMGFSEYLHDWAEDAVSEIVAQCHIASHPGGADPDNHHGNGPNAFTLIAAKGALQARVAKLPDRAYVPDKNSATHSTILAWEENRLTGNQWVDWVMHFKVSPEGDGFVRIWRNGKLVSEEKSLINGQTKWALCGEPIADGSASGQPSQRFYFPKLGIYKSDWRNRPSAVASREVYIDEIRIWAGAGENLAKVAPSGRASSALTK